MPNGLLAIIGGTGVDLHEHDEGVHGILEQTVHTRFGPAHVRRVQYHDRELMFLKRHARPDEPTRHDVPPHKVNYRANIAALKQLGVTAILASTAVGSLRQEWPTGTLVLLDQFIDCTTNRDKTFFDDSAVHSDATYPYCTHLRAVLLRAARETGLPLHDGGNYICCDGPRFETAAEIRAYAKWGADVVGMTGVPEVTLAREVNISYAGVSIVSNLAAGISQNPLTHSEVTEAMHAALPNVTKLFWAAARLYQDDPAAPARNVMAGHLARDFDYADFFG